MYKKSKILFYFSMSKDAIIVIRIRIDRANEKNESVARVKDACESASRVQKAARC